MTSRTAAHASRRRRASAASMSSRPSSRTRRSTPRRQCRSSMWPLRRASTARASSSGETPEASAKPTPLMSTTRWVQSGCRRAGEDLVDDRLQQRRAGDVELAVEPDDDRGARRAGRRPPGWTARCARRRAPSVDGRPVATVRAGREQQPCPACLPDPTPSTHAGAPPGRIAGWRGSSRPSAWSAWARWVPGIAEVFAREGLQVVGVEPDRGGARARPRAPAPLHRPGGHAGAS